MPASLAGSYNGLSFGVGQQVHVLEMVGIRDLPEIETTHEPKALTNGMFRGTVRTRGLSFTMVFGLIPNTRTPAGYDALLETVITAFGVQADTDLPLQFWGNTKYIYCHPTKRTIPLECESPQIGGEVTVEFFACDPTISTGTP